MDKLQNVRKILGVNFHIDDVSTIIENVSRGGLLVVPAAPALKDLARNLPYREALVNSDVAITDSAFMVILWNLMEKDSIPRISGLRYLRELLLQPDVRAAGNTLWVMAGPTSSRKNLEWLSAQGIEVPASHVYEAPLYGDCVEDPTLVRQLQKLHPTHVVITIGGGTQERLGNYLKNQLDYLPAIHCIGAAIGFLSGDQVKIPEWADRMGLGWLFRCVSAPRRFIPRYWSAFRLAPLMWKYRSRLPLDE